MRNIIAIAVLVLALACATRIEGPAQEVHAQARFIPNYGYIDISTGTTGSPVSTQVKTGSGTLHSIVVNGAGSAWTMRVYDNTTCTGTAIIVGGSAAVTVPAATTLLYDAGFLKGLCVATAGTTAGDMTVNFL